MLLQFVLFCYLLLLILLCESHATSSHLRKSQSYHMTYITERIVARIQDSLVFPGQEKNESTIFDKKSGIKYIIKKMHANDDNLIASNIKIANENPTARYMYEVSFFVFVVYENKKLLAPAVGSNFRNEDIFGLSKYKSVYFPRYFYETLDANNVIDVEEIFY